MGTESERRWRLTYRGEPRGPWRETRQEAQDDAVREGLGSWDEFEGGNFYTEPFAEIEVTQP